ncbi:hypothetical protein CL616_04720, partial [archaeon]|nr:hypothetical protein [archaeon]
ITNKTKLYPLFEKIDNFLDWFIQININKKSLDLEQETKFRHKLLDFNVNLLNTLHKEKGIDNSILTIFYFIVEMLDSSVSYLEIYQS